MKKKIRKIASGVIAVTIVAAGIFSYYFLLKAYPKVLASSYNVLNNEIVGSQEPVVIEFSEPIFQSTLEKSLSISPKTDVKLFWAKQNRRLIISPQDKWHANSNYRIDFSKAKNIFGAGLSSGELNFETEKYPRLISFFPENDARDVVLDIEDPITLEFDKPIDDYVFRIQSNPQMRVAYEKLSDRNGIKLMPTEEFQKGTGYNIKIWMTHREYELESQIADISFATKEAAPQTWEKDFAARLQQAKKLTTPLIRQGKYIDINLKSQVMTIFENGVALDAFLISSGKRGMDTPVMETKIYNKFPRAWSKTYQLFMPYWMAIRGDGKYGIHELPEWPGGYKEGANHLGTPVSHGCVRLGIGAAETVYNFAEIGTPVITHY